LSIAARLRGDDGRFLTDGLSLVMVTAPRLQCRRTQGIAGDRPYATMVLALTPYRWICQPLA